MFSEKPTFVTRDTTHKRDVGKVERNADHSDQVAPRKMTYIRTQTNKSQILKVILYLGHNTAWKHYESRGLNFICLFKCHAWKVFDIDVTVESLKLRRRLYERSDNDEEQILTSESFDSRILHESSFLLNPGSLEYEN